MLRLWNRLIRMDTNRITKQIFLYDYKIRNKNWCENIKSLFHTIDLMDEFNDKKACNMDVIRERLGELFVEKWKNNVENQLKLRTYKLFKTEFETEKYIMLNLV